MNMCYDHKWVPRCKKFKNHCFSLIRATPKKPLGSYNNTNDWRPSIIVHDPELFLTVSSIYPSWLAAVSSQQWTTGSTTTTTYVNSTTISPTSSSSLYTPPVHPKTHSYTLFFYFGVTYTHFPHVLLRKRSRWDGNAVCSIHKVSSFSVDKRKISTTDLQLYCQSVHCCIFLSLTHQSASVFCVIDKEPCSACTHTDLSVTLPFWLPKWCVTWEREQIDWLKYTVKLMMRG